MYFAYTFYPLFYISPYVYDRKLSEKLIFLGYLDVKTRFYMLLARNCHVTQKTPKGVFRFFRERLKASFGF